MGQSDHDARERARRIWDCVNGEEKIPIWLDCDTGHDDAFAILLAATCPKLNLLGISTIHGNASLENTTKNTLSILKAIGREDVEVIPGTTKPFCREAIHAESIHGISGLDGTTLLPAPPELPPEPQITAIDAMYMKLISQLPGTAWLVSTGALTNIALLFGVHPNITTHIRGLSIMGGAIGGFFSHAPLGRLRERIALSSTLYQEFPFGLPDDSALSLPQVASQFRALGLLKDADHLDDERVQLLLNEARQSFGNTTRYAEFNIYVDPEAASSIFSTPAIARKTTLIPLDVTHQVLATPAILDMVLHGYSNEDQGPSKLRQLFHEILTFFAETYASELAMTDGPPLHDPLAIAAALCPTLFYDNGGERYEVYVVKDGDESLIERRRNTANVGQCGRTIASMLKKGEEGVRIPRTLRVEDFWCLIDFALEAAENRGGMESRAEGRSALRS